MEEENAYEFPETIEALGPNSGPLSYAWSVPAAEHHVIASRYETCEYTRKDIYLKSLNKILSLEKSIEVLNEARPMWAKGYISDSMAAQGFSGACTGMWTELGVDNQTAAISKIKKLKEIEWMYRDLCK